MMDFVLFWACVVARNAAYYYSSSNKDVRYELCELVGSDLLIIVGMHMLMSVDSNLVGFGARARLVFKKLMLWVGLALCQFVLAWSQWRSFTAPTF